MNEEKMCQGFVVGNASAGNYFVAVGTQQENAPEGTIILSLHPDGESAPFAVIKAEDVLFVAIGSLVQVCNVLQDTGFTLPAYLESVNEETNNAAQ